MSSHVFPTSAGPKVRAGFSDAPLIGIAARCAATSVKGIASRAVPRIRSLLVDWRITRTKIVVRRNSIQKASQADDATPGIVAVDATASWSNAASTASAARTAPTNWAIQ
jgi:hypothetical protein